MRIAVLISILLAAFIAVALFFVRRTEPKPPKSPPLPAASDSDVKLGIGVQLVGAGRFQEALGMFEEILKVDPTNEKAKFNQAAMFAQLGRTAEAIAAFDKLVAETPEDALVLFKRADVLRELGRFDEALASCEKSIPKLPGQAEPHFLRARILTQLGRYDDALKELDLVETMVPVSPTVDFARADVRVAEGNTAAAEELYAKLLASFSADPRVKEEIDRRHKPPK